MLISLVNTASDLQVTDEEYAYFRAWDFFDQGELLSVIMLISCFSDDSPDQI